MVVRRFSGHHVQGEGSPSAFRTVGGAVVTGAASDIESKFSRKDETANLDGARQQHAQAIAQFDARRNSSIHLTNNSNYIFRLNNGWSAQTPGGFFERAVPEAAKAILGVWKLQEIG